MINMLKDCQFQPRDVPAFAELWREGPTVHVQRFVRDAETDRIRLSEDGAGPMIEDFAIKPEWIPEWIPVR
ncbi:hypothetical protein [Streptomyces cucumeris]|uniref:hypothetical protein n=1 Tax=Streptomyces cucumeris TaxID=2962890 RepID=UPI0020C85835|nr:hypothetical protein [Streptomyces sp. NEAU-Y11]MCP9209672.1 hypothetical protein [Streptomyces sp. NEAU-Y11]